MRVFKFLDSTMKKISLSYYFEVKILKERSFILSERPKSGLSLEFAGKK